MIGYDHTFPISINTIVPEISQPKGIALKQIAERHTPHLCVLPCRLYKFFTFI